MGLEKRGSIVERTGGQFLYRRAPAYPSALQGELNEDYEGSAALCVRSERVDTFILIFYWPKPIHS